MYTLNRGVVKLTAQMPPLCTEDNKTVQLHLKEFGWAFGDLMRDRPTVCTPDDHDVYQVNLWGEGGKKIPFADWQRYSVTDGGYVQPAEMVNVVHKTQCSH